ncbi:hypothetical protein QCA50_001112 [Cerrena zonata]|uniref:Synembryn-A n=1 Tax=Cerrena zonata TaxID=2478898 RepID=A0AAW0GYL6_9APHY
MSNLQVAYSHLSHASSRNLVSNLLNDIVNAFPTALHNSDRIILIQAILDDLSLLTKGSKDASSSRLHRDDAALALLALKNLCKIPVGSQVLTDPTNLSTLIAFANTFKDNVAASNEALRCLANCLLLVEEARSIFVQKSVGGGEAAAEWLLKASAPERVFLASRILFLSTVSLASASTYIRSLIESKPPGHTENIVDVVNSKIDMLLFGIQSGEMYAKEATIDILKMLFNLLAHYPKISDDASPTSQNTTDDHKVLGDQWSDRLDSVLPPLLKLFNNLPPSAPAPLLPPIPHVIHCLIAVPVTPALRPIWFSNQTKSEASSRSSKTSSPSGTPSGSHSNGSSPTHTKHGAFDRALSRLSASRKSFSRSSSPQPPPVYDNLQHAYDLLDTVLSHYLPGSVEPDEASVRERCQKDADSSLDDIVAPLVILITRLCAADEASRKRLRGWILPDDLDRTTPLESRSDLLGRCLRLLASVHHPRLKDVTGEMLYTVCDSDASTLSSYVGYGNVAGFLFNKGIMSAPPATANSTLAPSTTPSGAAIDPITGQIQRERPPLEMTDEEKEIEAEKLFVLFDRLERNGALSPNQNPIRRAIQEGKMG